MTGDYGQNNSRDGRQDSGNYTVPLSLAWTAPQVGVGHLVTDGTNLVGWKPISQNQTTQYEGFDFKTGHRLWGPIILNGFSSVALGGGNVIITGGPRLLALDPATGKQRWSVSIPLSADDEALIRNGIIYVVAGRYSVATGKRLGGIALPATFEGGRFAYGGGCIIARDAARVWCLNPNNGNVIWKRTDNLVGPDPKPAVYSNNRVYLYNAYSAAPDVLDARTGAVIGHAPVPLAVGDNLGYGWATDGMQQAIKIVGFSVPDGASRWTYQLPMASDGYHFTMDEMTLSNGVLYVLAGSLDTSPQVLFALNSQTGKLLWRSDSEPQLGTFYSSGSLTVAPPFIALVRNVGGRDGTPQLVSLRMSNP